MRNLNLLPQPFEHLVPANAMLGRIKQLFIGYQQKETGSNFLHLEAGTHQ